MDKEKSRDAGLALVLILLLAAWVGAGIHHPLIAVAAAGVLICMTAPRLFAPFAVFWFGLSRILGAVVSRIVLSAVYLLVVVPVAMMRRLAGKDTMRLKQWKKDDGSVFVERNHLYTREDVRHPY
ncbi:MAG: SxtJ family membrane protein [Thermodesulfobacteriota bacterium]